MKRFLLFLLLCGFCDSAYADRDSDCREQAKKRVELYNKPDSYEINEKEKANALLALYSQCMREEDPKTPDGLAAKVGNSSDSTVIYTQGVESSFQQGGIVKTVKGNGSASPTIVIVQSPAPVYAPGGNNNITQSAVIPPNMQQQPQQQPLQVYQQGVQPGVAAAFAAPSDPNMQGDKVPALAENNKVQAQQQLPPNIIINNNIPANAGSAAKPDTASTAKPDAASQPAAAAKASTPAAVPPVNVSVVNNLPQPAAASSAAAKPDAAATANKQGNPPALTNNISISDNNPLQGGLPNLKPGVGDVSLSPSLNNPLPVKNAINPSINSDHANNPASGYAQYSPEQGGEQVVTTPNKKMTISVSKNAVPGTENSSNADNSENSGANTSLLPPISGNIAVNSDGKLPLNPQELLKNQAAISANQAATANPDIYATDNIPPQSQNSYSSDGKPEQAVPSVSNNTIPSGSPAAASGAGSNGNNYALPSLSGSLTTGGTNPGNASYNAGSSTIDNPARKNASPSPVKAATIADKPSVSVVNNYPAPSAKESGGSASGKSSGGSTPVVSNNIPATPSSGGGTTPSGGSSGKGNNYALPSLSGSLTTGGTNPGNASYNAGSSNIDNPARKNANPSPVNAANIADKPSVSVVNNYPASSAKESGGSASGKSSGGSTPVVSNNIPPASGSAATPSSGNSYALPSLSGSLTAGGTNPGAASYNAGSSGQNGVVSSQKPSEPYYGKSNSGAGVAGVVAGSSGSGYSPELEQKAPVYGEVHTNMPTIKTPDKQGSVYITNNPPAYPVAAPSASSSGKNTATPAPAITNNISAAAPSGGGSGSGAGSPVAAKNPAISLPGVNVASPNPSLNMPVNPNLPNPAASANIPPIQGQKTGSKTISSSMTAPDAGKKPLQAPIESKPLESQPLIDNKPIATPQQILPEKIGEVKKVDPVKPKKKSQSSKKTKKNDSKTNDNTSNKSVYTPVGDAKKLEDIIGR